MKKKLNFLVTVAYWGVLAIILWLVLRYVLPPALPFLVGFTIAGISNPLVCRLTKNGKRLPASLAVILPLWAILILIFWKSGALLYREIVDLVQWFSSTNLTEYFSSLKLPFLKEEAIRWIADRADTFLPALLDMGRSFLGKFADLLLMLPNAMVFLFATIASSVLFSVSYPKIEPFIVRQLPLRLQTEYFDIKDFLIRKIFRFLRAQGTMLMINSAVLFLGFWFLKCPYPLIFAVLIALADLLPYVGMAFVLVPWGLVQWLIFANPVQGIGLLILAAAVTIIRELLEPRIVGKNIGLSPLATLISIYLGLRLLGLAGVFVVPLLVILIKEWNESGRILLWKNEPE